MARSVSNTSSGVFSMSQNANDLNQTDSMDVDGMAFVHICA